MSLPSVQIYHLPSVGLLLFNLTITSEYLRGWRLVWPSPSNLQVCQQTEASIFSSLRVIAFCRQTPSFRIFTISVIIFGIYFSSICILMSHTVIWSSFSWLVDCGLFWLLCCLCPCCCSLVIFLFRVCVCVCVHVSTTVSRFFFFCPPGYALYILWELPLKDGLHSC